jgi:hypothetical protein
LEEESGKEELSQESRFLICRVAAIPFSFIKIAEEDTAVDQESVIINGLENSFC